VADLVSDGKIRIYWVPTIANIAAPTVAELNAGTRLDTFVTPDGLKRDWTTQPVDNSRISSTFDTEDVGRRKPALGVTIIRQDGTDTIAALLVYRAVGYLVIRDNIDASVAWAAAQKAQVFPAKCHQASPLYGPNTLQRQDIPMSCTSDPDVNATVA
jgi:hypothetical protein